MCGFVVILDYFFAFFSTFPLHEKNLKWALGLSIFLYILMADTAWFQKEIVVKWEIAGFGTKILEPVC